jgi:hypothetical protein
MEGVDLGDLRFTFIPDPPQHHFLHPIAPHPHIKVSSIQTLVNHGSSLRPLPPARITSSTWTPTPSLST